VVAADISASMLNMAAEAARKAGMTNVETRVMNAENLDFDTDSFDAVVCRIALVLFPNPAKALAEMRRVKARRQSRSDGLRRLREKSLLGDFS
jgi:ubiquinone/menaquinone biosynthesis C-methylase UbiE